MAVFIPDQVLRRRVVPCSWRATAGSFRQTVRPDPEKAGTRLDLRGPAPMPTPELFTVTEAAIVLRIGRTTAYELARRDLATDGGEGLDVRLIGRAVAHPPGRA